MKKLRGRAGEALAVTAAHAGLGVVFFLPAFLFGRVLAPLGLLRAVYPWGAYLGSARPDNPALLDVVQQFYPWFLELRRALLAGRFPLWSPDLAFGVPYAANPLTASFFPLSYLALAGPVVGWNLLLLGRVVIAGAGAFVFLRALGRGRVAAALGSLAYAYSLPFLPFLPMSIGNVNALLPWLLLAALHLSRRPGARSAALFAGVLLLSHLGGQPEATAFHALAAAVVAIGATRAPLNVRARTAAFLAAGVAAGTLAAAAQVLPFLSYLSRSRAFLEPETRFQAFPLRGLVTWAVPEFWEKTAERIRWGGMPASIDLVASAGVVLLGAALVTLGWSRARRWGTPALLFALVVSLCYGLPPVAWLRFVPLVGKVRYQRLLPIAALAVAVLGAAGIDRLRALRRRGSARRLAAAAAVTLLPLLPAFALAAMEAGAAPTFAFRATALTSLAKAALLLGAGALLASRGVAPRLRAAGLTLLVLEDVWLPMVGYHGASDPALAYFPTPVTRLLGARPDGARVLPLGFTMPPNTNVPPRVASLLAYDAVDDVVQVRFLRHLGGYFGKSFFSTVFPQRIRNPRVLELAACRYLVADPQAPPLDTTEYRALSGLALHTVSRGADGAVYELAGVRPRVWGSGRAIADPGLVRFERLLSAGDPASSTVPFVDAPEIPAGDGAPVRVAVLARTPEELRAATSSSGRAWLFFSEGGFPDWVATVDGRAARVFRASGPFQAVPLAAGEHRVEIRYRPRSVRLGLALSALGFGLLAIAAGGARAGRRTPV